MSLQIASPQKSPHLDEYGNALYTDSNGNVIPVVALVQPAADGTLNLSGMTITQGQVSQVTGRKGPATVTTPGGLVIPLLAMLKLDASGNPLQSGAKFQSTVQTGTGSAQNIAHGLGVVPSLVLVAIYDTNGVALPHAIVEGTHTSTNVVVTVTASVKFKVIAIA